MRIGLVGPNIHKEIKTEGLTFGVIESIIGGEGILFLEQKNGQSRKKLGKAAWRRAG